MVLRRKRVASAERVRELIDSAFAARYQEVETMLELSSRAVVLAEEKRDELPDDLMVAAWTQYGNALRIAGRYPEAEKALERASSWPTTDVPTRIHCLEITASLYRSTGRFESAARLLTLAIEGYRALEDTDGVARTHTLLGIVHFDRGDVPQALRAYKTALDLTRSDATVESFAAVTTNLVEGLIADGSLSAAAAALVLLEPFHLRLTSARLSAKAVWMRARLYRKLKQLDAARLTYKRAYALLSTEPRVPELAELALEMAELGPLPELDR
jgi:tetratricopeptide (TPR) repeat protein